MTAHRQREEEWQMMCLSLSVLSVLSVLPYPHVHFPFHSTVRCSLVCYLCNHGRIGPVLSLLRSLAFFLSLTFPALLSLVLGLWTRTKQEMHYASRPPGTALIFFIFFVFPSCLCCWSKKETERYILQREIEQGISVCKHSVQRWLFASLSIAKTQAIEKHIVWFILTHLSTMARKERVYR